MSPALVNEPLVLIKGRKPGRINKALLFLDDAVWIVFISYKIHSLKRMENEVNIPVCHTEILLEMEMEI